MCWTPPGHSGRESTPPWPRTASGPSGPPAASVDPTVPDGPETVAATVSAVTALRSTTCTPAGSPIARTVFDAHPRRIKLASCEVEPFHTEVLPVEAATARYSAGCVT